MTADALTSTTINWVENTSRASFQLQWANSLAPSDFVDMPDNVFWSEQKINGVNDIVISPPTSPAGSTLESQPAAD